jgi:DNA-binding transcriptional regulator/RsmH inhibitor MraZ
MRVKRQYSYVSSTIDEGEIIDVPEQYRQLLVSGALVGLTARPRYKDEDLFKYNKEIFEREYVNLKFQYDNLEPSYESRDMTYKY